MGACCSEFDGEMYEEDFSSDERHLEGAALGVANTTLSFVTRTPPGPMLVVKDDALGLTGVSRKEVFPPPELPRLGLRGPLKCETAEEVMEKTLAKDLKTRSHLRGLSFANGLRHLGDPKEEAANMEEHEEAEEAKESKTWEFWEEAVDEFIKKWPPLEKMKALVEELEEESAEKPEDLKIRSHLRGHSCASWTRLPALKEDPAAEEHEESGETEENTAEKMLIKDLNTWPHQEGLSVWFETMDG